MNKTELDRKYYPQYLELLNLVQEGLKIEVNTELDFNGDFIDKRVAFGYAIFVLERIRVEKVSTQIEEVAKKGFDDMYQLGQLSVLSQKRSQASKYFGADGGNY